MGGYRSGYWFCVRFLFAVLALLILGLLAQSVLDSAVGAWIAFGSLMVVVLIQLVGWLGLWPAD